MALPVFLSAEWRKLAIANYEIDPAILKPLLPNKTELDFWEGNCYVSLVGFMFLHTKLKGIRIPFHNQFEEVNLRFYVRYQENEVWKRGVTFIKEIVPKPALTFIANTFYSEKYVTLPMAHTWQQEKDQLTVEYRWKGDQWYWLKLTADSRSIPLLPGSKEAFITEHYWGYTSLKKESTGEYGVEHPQWDIYPVKDYAIHADFGKLYGKSFEVLNHLQPASVMLAEGSPVVVRTARKI